MDIDATVTCSNRSAETLIAAFSIAIFVVGAGVPLLAFFVSFNHRAGTILSIVFIIALIIMISYMILRWKNRSIEASYQGLNYTSPFGKTIHFSWDNITITDDYKHGKLIFIPNDSTRPKRIVFSQFCKSFTDMRSYLRKNEHLVDTQGRKRKITKHMATLEVLESEHLSDY